MLSTGWLARFLETRYKNYPQGFPDKLHPDPPAIKTGDTGSFLFQGNDIDMSVIINPTTGFQLPDIDIVGNDADTFAAIEMQNISEVLLQTQRYSQNIKKALGTSFEHSKRYPKEGDNPLADQLKIVSKLINSGSRTQVYLVI